MGISDNLFREKKEKEVQENDDYSDSENLRADQACWTTYCRSCRAEIKVPRRTPPFGTSLVCPKCKTPIQSVHEDPPGCPIGWSSKQTQLLFGYDHCCIEHPRCPFCSKLVYAVVFPEQGGEVAWYVVEQQDNPMANYAIKVQCIHCARTFIVEWDGWPFSLDSDKKCNFCSIIGVGDSQFMTIPEDRRAQFESNLGKKASTLPYLRDKNGSPLWVACPICLKTALRNYDREQGTDLAQVYSLGPELDPFVDELLRIDQTDGLMVEAKGSSVAYDSRGRHKRGREIGEILCMKGGHPLMLRVGNAFINRGGTEWRLSHCWHEIRDKDGNIA